LSRPRPSVVMAAVEPVGAFLKSISVEGFRGIGPRATLELHPAAGQTVVDRRNVSAKLSFSEGLAAGLRGTTHAAEVKQSTTSWVGCWKPHLAPSTTGSTPGIDSFKKAQDRLAAVLKEVQEPEKHAKAAAKELKAELAGIEDERATLATRLLGKRTPDLDAV